MWKVIYFGYSLDRCRVAIRESYTRFLEARLKETKLEKDYNGEFSHTCLGNVIFIKNIGLFSNFHIADYEKLKSQVFENLIDFANKGLCPDQSYEARTEAYNQNDKAHGV